jgi:folate-binding protein YgfZ
MTERADQDDARLGAELATLREGAAVSPLDARGVLAARGADRGSFLQGMLSNDVEHLAPGQGVYALLLTEQGRPVAEMVVLALADAFWLEMDRAALPRVREALERYVVADDVELEDAAVHGVAVRGRAASGVLGAVLGVEGGGLDALRECDHLELAHAGAPLHVARLNDVGVDGFHLWTPSLASRDALADALVAAGARRLGDDALEVQRIAAGFARGDVDYGPQTLAAEVPSFARAVSYRKGCYLGQEVMERVAARGHVNWLLVRLTADAPFAAGARVKDGDVEVGRVTSVARAPGVGTIALARVRAAVAEAGRTLAVEGDATDVPVVLATVPVQE